MRKSQNIARLLPEAKTYLAEFNPDLHLKKIYFKSGNKFVQFAREWFEKCADAEIHPTYSGLCVALGTTREGLNQWHTIYPHLSRAIKNTRAFLEAYNEQLLLTRDKPAGIIFNLKNNAGWMDKLEIETSNKIDLTFTVVKQDEKTGKLIDITPEKCKAKPVELPNNSVKQS